MTNKLMGRILADNKRVENISNNFPLSILKTSTQTTKAAKALLIK